MKRIGLIAALALLFSLPVAGLAQGNKPAAAKPQTAAVQPATKPAAAKPAEAKPQTVAVQSATKPASDGPKRSRANEDARSCLELATNIEIHKCAEKYR